ncbi:MAG TPA: hypothetical protein VKR42_14350 [Ktedonobacteraceae bacterium]|nr:hypothetical protein [Ktedonobacteraceae bacterium]
MLDMLNMQHIPYILASSDPLAPWGQAAAIVLLFYFLIVILLGLGLTLGLMFGLSWVREKTELIKKLRPTVDSVNTTTESAMNGTLPEATAHDNKIVRTVAEVPARIYNIEQKIEQGSDRVAGAVIEFRARTQMTKAIVKAFFLPGLTDRQPTLSAPEEDGVDFKSPGYRMLVEENAPTAETGVGAGYSGTIHASDIKEAPVR